LVAKEEILEDQLQIASMALWLCESRGCLLFFRINRLG